MDIQKLVNDLMVSEHGQNAASALAEQGLSTQQVDQVFNEVAGVAQTHLTISQPGVLGVPNGQSLVGMFATGLANRTGFADSLKDGLSGALSLRLVDALAGKIGIEVAALPGVMAALSPVLAKLLSSKPAD
jgi:hypothetical protein